MTIQTAMYESDIWNVRKSHETRLQTADMKILRGLVEYTDTDH
jgi:hypothetical protein